MTVEAEPIGIEALERAIQQAFEYADRETPGWRGKLDEYDLYRSDLPEEVLYKLAGADTAQLLLTGHSYRAWRTSPEAGLLRL